MRSKSYSPYMPLWRHQGQLTFYLWKQVTLKRCTEFCFNLLRSATKTFDVIAGVGVVLRAWFTITFIVKHEWRSHAHRFLSGAGDFSGALRDPPRFTGGLEADAVAAISPSSKRQLPRRPWEKLRSRFAMFCSISISICWSSSRASYKSVPDQEPAEPSGALYHTSKVTLAWNKTAPVMVDCW